MLQPDEVVVSKFFITNNLMDQSLSDFQPKKKLKCPAHVTSKTSTNKSRQKQKDIRKFLNDKKSDIVEDFENYIRVCKKANLDVDLDHLQLAIALSKSIQDQNDGCVAGSSQEPKNSKKSLGRVKQSLVEYGFNLSNLNVKKKRFKKQRKNSKLLKISDAERKQTVASKFADVLFGNPKENYGEGSLNTSEDNLFVLATSVSYNKLISDDIFVVKNIFRKETNTVGSLLKDWAKIPGRPLSPLKQNRPIQNVADTFINKNFDVLLSGTFKMIDEFIESKTITTESVNCSKAHENRKQESYNINNSNAFVTIRDLSCNAKLIKPNTTVARPTSPDIFSEESFSTMNSYSENLNQHTFDLQDRIEVLETKPSTRRQSRTSELVKNNTKDGTIKVLSPNRQENTLCCTQIISQDFMDLTECADKQRLEALSPENRHITKSTFIFADDGMELTKCVNKSHTGNESLGQNINSKREVINEVDSYDLTQSSDSEESLPLITIQNENLLPSKVLKVDEKPISDKNIDATPSHDHIFQSENLTSFKNKLSSEIVNNEHSVSHEIISADINNVSCTDEELKNEQFIESGDPNLETINCQEVTSNISEHLEVNPQKEINFSNIHNNSSDSTIYDLMQPLKFTKNSPNKCNISHSDSSQNLDLSLSSQYSEVFEISDEEIEYSMMNSKKDDVDSSDELDEKRNINSVTTETQECNYKDEDTNTYQHHSDHELFSNIDPPIYEDYDNYNNCIDISEQSDTRQLNSSMENECDIKLSNSNIPNSVDQESNMSKQSENESGNLELSGFKAVANKFMHKVTSSDTEMTVSTPGQHQYVLKTSNVTPMPEYASMQTVERNKELMKYGIRPFKRKRAVQLLEHVYRQTHPLCEDADPKTIHETPSKRNKTEEQSRNSDHNHISPNPEEQLQPGIKGISKGTPTGNNVEIDPHLEKANEMQCSNDICHDDNIFTLTDERPQLAEVMYDEEDLVLPKGRISKRAGCAVPLHIALWNLVGSARRLRESILRYEPVDIGGLHRVLAAHGHRYEPKDLLRFMDRKGITVKTCDNAKRTKKR